MRERRSPLKWSPRPPCMDEGLGLLFEIGGSISGSVTKWEAICPDYKEYPVICEPTGNTRQRSGSLLLMVQNHAQVHRKPTGDLVPFSIRRVCRPRIGSKPLRFSI
jgi:hypothetical protein